MSRTSHLALIALLPALLVLPGCGGHERCTHWPAATAPTASVAGTTVRITGIARTPDTVTLDLVIANAGDIAVAFARDYRHFTAAALVQGNTRITGTRIDGPIRTMPADRFTIAPGETTTLRLIFTGPDADRATDLHLFGTSGDIARTWTITLPATPTT